MPMLRIGRAFVFLLLWAFLPGGQAMLEQAGHLAFEDHGIHSPVHEDADHPRSAEDDCAGTMHSCHCCRVSALIPDFGNEPASGIAPGDADAFVAGPRTGVGVSLFRPPIA